jgi:D-serine deaminase-like pyridoxal phosphate-dependent protein
MIGRHQSELDTPALCIDLDVMEANMQAMAEFLKERNKQWRPHVKCHKVPAISHRQLRLGAIGVTSAKVSEAEVFIQNGVPDVLIANMIAGEAKYLRIAGMCRQGSPIVACDHFAQAEALSAVCMRQGVRCRVIIEVNIGLNRVGIRPGPDARTLAQGIGQLPGVELVGIMGYEGHLLTVPDLEEKRAKIFSALSLLEEQRDAMTADGLNCEIVSAGGTGSYQITADHPAVTELQAGGGIFGDPHYLDRCQVEGLRPVVKVIATVASRPQLDRAILDIGRKTVHPDIYSPAIFRTATGRELADVTVGPLSAEHTNLELGPDSQDLVIGDKVEVIPGYSDHTTVLHDRFHGLRNGYVECIWPIQGRGKLQ